MFLDFCRSPFEVVSFMGELFGRSRTTELFLLLCQVSPTLFYRFDVLAQEHNIYKVETASWQEWIFVCLCPFPGNFLMSTLMKGLWPASGGAGWRCLHCWNGSASLD